MFKYLFKVFYIIQCHKLSVEKNGIYTWQLYMSVLQISFSLLYTKGSSLLSGTEGLKYLKENNWMAFVTQYALDVCVCCIPNTKKTMDIRINNILGILSTNIYAIVNQRQFTHANPVEW